MWFNGTQPFYVKRYGRLELPNVTEIDKYGFYVPNHPRLKPEEIEYVCDIINEKLSLMNKKFTSRKIRDCNFEGVKFIEQDAYQDHRGYYYTIYDNTIDSKNNYVRDKISSSSKNVLRGIHGDYKTTKLITCVHGEVYCVIVDNREDSETFSEWSWEILSLHNRNILVLPPG